MSNDSLRLEEEILYIISQLNYLTSVYAFKSIESTNDYALKLESEGIESGALIITEEQNKGRGRLNRRWFMQRGDIAFSLLLRPPFVPHNRALLPMLAGVAVVKALKELNFSVRLKWPNDIIIASSPSLPLPYLGTFRKIGGILVENVFREDIFASIIGIGINRELNPELKTLVPHAASLAEYNPKIDHFSCLERILYRLDEAIGMLGNPEKEKALYAEYLTHCETLGRLVTIAHEASSVSGRVTAIKSDGSLVLNDGLKDHVLYAGEANFSGK